MSPVLIDLGPATAVGPDLESATAVTDRIGRVIRPTGALRRLDELAVWLASWQRTTTPRVETTHVTVFAGEHGVTAEEVSAYPPSVTAAMVEALRSGTATAAVMATKVGASFSVVDVGRGVPTANIRTSAALTEAAFDEAFEIGRSELRAVGPVDVFVPGEVGIGNTTAAAAVAAALLGGDIGAWVGRGTGLDDAGLARKTTVVEEAVRRIDGAEPLDVLRRLGGWELAAIAGSIVAARESSTPVLLDGFVVTAAAMALELAQPGLLGHCWPAHVSAEPGHRMLVERLGRPPILDLEMRLGEASGALAALPVLGLAAAAVTDVATFAELGLE